MYIVLMIIGILFLAMCFIPKRKIEKLRIYILKFKNGRFISKFIPKEGSMSETKYNKRLSYFDNLKIEDILFYKFCTFIVMCGILTLLSFVIINNNAKGTLRTLSKQQSSTISVNGKLQNENILLQEKFARDVISVSGNRLNKVPSIMVRINKQQQLNYTNKQLEEIYTVIAQYYECKQFKFAYILIILLCSILSTLGIDLSLEIIIKYKLKLVDREVERLQAICSVLLVSEEVNIYNILMNMLKNSKYLKEQLTVAVNSYNINPEKALDTLSEEVGNKNFTKFIATLKSCLHTEKNLTIKLLDVQNDLNGVIQDIELEDKINRKVIRLTIATLPLIVFLILISLLPVLTNLDFGLGL